MILEKTMKFEVAEKDLPELMTYFDAEKYVRDMGEGWRIPTREELLLMYASKEIIGTFDASNKGDGSGCPGWYWSSTGLRDGPSGVWVVRFSGGSVDWYLKDYYRLSCRPVRLVEASVSVPAPVGD